jgi:ParB family transcriptional regulator, chromosome partitioning protein
MAVLRSLPLDSIEASPHNPRRAFDEESLQSLAESIARLGLLQPILVLALPDADRYQIIAGERRWRASRLADKAEIPALVIDLDAPELRETQIVENLEREPLNPVDEARAYQALQLEFGYSEAEVARRMQRSITYVRNRLYLLNLCEEALQLVADRRINIATASEIANLSDHADQAELAQRADAEGWTAKQAAANIARLLQERRVEAVRVSKRLSLERKVIVLEMSGKTVVTPTRYDPERHHRVWDLIFPECSTCERKGVFVRADGQLEDVCVEPNCFTTLLTHRVQKFHEDQRAYIAQRERMFSRLLETDEITTQHLQYLLWSMLGLLGSAADAWRIEHNLPTHAEASLVRSAEWEQIHTWQETHLLTAIMRLGVSYLAALNNEALPAGLRESLYHAFDIPADLLGLAITTDTDAVR